MRRRPLLLLLVLAVLAGGLGLAQAAPARATRAAAPLGLVSGPDVASYQHDSGQGIGWGQVARTGRGFAVVKATEGTRYTNPWFSRDWAGMRAAGLVRATYHFAAPSRAPGSAAGQARRFVRTVGARANEDPTLPLVLDIEQSGGLRPAELQEWTRVFLTTVESLTRRTPIVYTYPAFWHDRMGDSAAFTRYPLWIASYTAAPPTPLPGGWSSWTLWQYTDRGHVPGVRGGVDLSVFCCSPAALVQLTARSTPVTERWAALGGAAGALGLPLGPETALAGGRLRDFAGGSVYWTPGTGARVLTGAVLLRYRGLGGPTSALGWPATDVLPFDTAGGPGTHAVFAGGRLYAGPADPLAWLLPAGPLLDDWLLRSGTAGPLGMPTGDAGAVTGGVRGTFAGGQLLASPERGTHELHGPVLTQWLDAGGPDSAFGLPSTDTYAVPGGEQAEFGPGLVLRSF